MRSSRSSSGASDRSASSPNAQDTHNIFVKLLSGETIPLTVPSSTPIQHLQHLLSLRTSLPASSIRLVHAGRHLTDTATSATLASDENKEGENAVPPLAPPQTLSSLGIPTNSTLHLLLPILGGTGTPSSSGPPAPIAAAATTTTSDATSTSAPTQTSTSTSSTSTPVYKKPRRRCTFKECRSAPQPIVGDCSFCSGHYCGKHRMLEDHRCTGLEDCKQEAHERNKEVLEGQKTVALRGI